MFFRTESRLGCSICDFYLHECHRIQYVFLLAWVTFLCVDGPGKCAFSGQGVFPERSTDPPGHPVYGGISLATIYRAPAG